MSWRIEVKPAAEKQYLKLDRKSRQRIKAALVELQELQQPLHHHRMRPLTGKLRGDYRLRVGGWRILCTPDREELVIHVYAILPRGNAY